MKKKLVFLLLIIPFMGICQANFYRENGNKVSVLGEQTFLIFSKNSAIDIPSMEGYDKGFSSPLIATLAPSIIDIGFKISSNLIEKNLKKYTSEFSAKNTYINTEKYINGFSIQRQIILNSKKLKENAFVIEFIPLQIDENTFVFAIDKVLTKYSGAKSKNGYNYNDYIIEIKVSYYDGKEKKEQTSSPILLQLIEISSEGNSYLLKDTNSNQHIYLSDKFLLNPGFRISEISVKVIETNTAKVKAEKIKSFYDKYSEDSKESVKNIMNFYVEKSK